MATNVNKLEAYAYESITVSSTAKRLTLANIYVTPPAKAAIVSVDSAPIRWRDDGTDPTSSEGHFAIPTGEPIVLDNANRMVDFRAIRQSSTDASIRISYYR